MKFVVVMPFHPDFQPVYTAIKSSVQGAAPSEDLVCLRVDEDLTGRITRKIDEHLRSADICIADVTNFNPNVMWEVGFIEALRKPLIALSQSTTNLPFNIHDVPIIQYVPSMLDSTLEATLRLAITQMLQALEARQQARSTALPVPSGATITITGSRTISPSKAAQAARSVVSPYLHSGVTWYCGTSGQVDNEAAKVLLEAGETVVFVSTPNRLVSPEILTLIEKFGASLVDANKVPFARKYSDLDNRDTLLITKADLVILVWDGESRVTKRLHDWLTEHHREHIVVVI